MFTSTVHNIVQLLFPVRCFSLHKQWNGCGSSPGELAADPDMPEINDADYAKAHIYNKYMYIIFIFNIEQTSWHAASAYQELHQQQSVASIP